MESEFFKRFIAQIEFLLFTFALPLALLMEASTLPYRDLSSLDGLKPFLVMLVLFSIELALWILKESGGELKKAEIKHFQLNKDMFFMYSVFALMSSVYTLFQGEMMVSLYQLIAAMVLVSKHLLFKRIDSKLN